MNFTERQPFSPGEILLEEFLQPLHLTTVELAHLINVEAQHVHDIIHHQAAYRHSIRQSVWHQCRNLVELANAVGPLPRSYAERRNTENPKHLVNQNS